MGLHHPLSDHHCRLKICRLWYHCHRRPVSSILPHWVLLLYLLIQLLHAHGITTVHSHHKPCHSTTSMLFPPHVLLMNHNTHIRRLQSPRVPHHHRTGASGDHCLRSMQPGSKRRSGLHPMGRKSDIRQCIYIVQLCNNWTGMEQGINGYNSSEKTTRCPVPSILMACAIRHGANPATKPGSPLVFPAAAGAIGGGWVVFQGSGGGSQSHSHFSWKVPQFNLHSLLLSLPF